MTTTTVRNPDVTRQRLLEAAFTEIYQHGYQGMRVDDVLKRTGLGKGAFYHHFTSKHALGCAVVDEIINGEMGQRWMDALGETEDPIPALEQVMDLIVESETGNDGVFLGCPLNNLAMEMSAQDAAFRQRIEELFSQWINLIARAFARGQQAGTVRNDIDPQEAGMFLVASFEGCVGLAKATQNMDNFIICRKQITHYLNSLRP